MQVLKKTASLILRIWRSVVAILETALLPSQRRRWEAVARQGPPPWDARNRVIGRMISPGSVVYDIGSGAQTLRQYIPSATRYVPCDLVQTTPEVVPCDLNAGIYPPPDPNCTHVVCSGVFEYMRSPREFLLWVGEFAPQVILSYNPMRPGDSKLTRMSHHWCNHYTEKALSDLFASVGLFAQEVARLPSHEIVYRITRKRDS